MDQRYAQGLGKFMKPKMTILFTIVALIGMIFGNVQL